MVLLNLGSRHAESAQRDNDESRQQLRLHDVGQSRSGRPYGL
jgi:hypothetical protein